MFQCELDGVGPDACCRGTKCVQPNGPGRGDMAGDNLECRGDKTAFSGK